MVRKYLPPFIGLGPHRGSFIVSYVQTNSIPTISKEREGQHFAMINNITIQLDKDEMRDKFICYHTLIMDVFVWINA